MTMSKMKNTLTTIFIGAAMIGAPVIGGFAGGYLYDRYADPVTIPQTIADLPQESCLPDVGCLKIPQERLETHFAAIHANPEEYKRRKAQEERFAATLIGFGAPMIGVSLAALAIVSREDRRKGQQP